MPDPNPNLDHANAAAAAVDPNSPVQKNFIENETGLGPGRSYADVLAGRGVQVTESDKSFFSGLDKANRAKEALEGGAEAEPGPSSETAESSPPAPPRKLTDPPVAPRQRSNFRKLEAERDALRSKLAALEKGGGGGPTAGEGLTSTTSPVTSSSSPDSEQVLAMSKELETLRSELALLDITRSPEFNAKFEAPRSITIKQAKNIAGDKGAEVEVILSMPPGALRDQKLDELLNALPPSTASIVRAANNKLSELDFYKQVEMETHRATATEKAQARVQAQQREATIRMAEFEALAKEWSTGVDVLNPAKSPAAPELLATAKSYFDGSKLSHKERAAVALQAALVPSLLAEQTEMSAEIERLQATLARYTNSLPGAEPASPDTDLPATPDTPEARSKAFFQGLERAKRSDPTFAAVRRPNRY
jgi:hypothetical protein